LKNKRNISTTEKATALSKRLPVSAKFKPFNRQGGGHFFSPSFSHIEGERLTKFRSFGDAVQRSNQKGSIPELHTPFF